MTRYQHIPVTRRQVVRALVEEAHASAQEENGVDPARFTELAQLLQAVYHFEMHERLEAMKQDYAPFNPDFDVDEGGDRSEVDKNAQRLSKAVTGVLERGNYHTLDQQAIVHAFAERSLFPVVIQVDMEFFDEIKIFARGESLRNERIATWFGLIKRDVEVKAYDRVCLYIRCKETAEIPGKKRKRLGKSRTYQPGRILLKLFRNIPKNDLEMLFPSYEVRMRNVDKLLLGVPAVAAGVPLMGKLGPALLAISAAVGLAEGAVTYTSLITGLTGMVMLGTYLFTQWSRFQFQRAVFMRTLSENLYFRNLDNNEGVLTRLIDDAEEEECKEALLAYFFLLRAGGRMDGDGLDDRIEQWFYERFEIEIDFDVDDALVKLERLGIGLATESQGVWQAMEIGEALRLVHKRWDNFFTTRSSEPVTTAS